MKIGLVMICTGSNYWPFTKQVIESARTHFLPGKQVDVLLWTDIPSQADERVQEAIAQNYLQMRAPYGVQADQAATMNQEVQGHLNSAIASVDFVNESQDIIKFSTEHTSWPYPTLMRYHLFLQQEEELKEYDYLFYCDVDMVFVDTVGDEILGDGLTAAQHPMYALRKELIFPLEPNPQSAAYINTPKFYYAGGFQGGTTGSFLKAMWACKRAIDTDFNINYLARWNDESHWNRYLLDNPPVIVLSPSYVYPDSLIKEYYEKIWGCSYHPRLITITKKFTTNKEGGTAVKQMIDTL